MKWQILIVELSVANKKGILWMQKQYMIIDLEKRGDKRMFITEQVSSIYKNKNGLWTVQFLSSPRVFNYNQSRLFYLTHPEFIDLNEKDCTSKTSISLMLQNYFALQDGRHTFYHITYANGY